MKAIKISILVLILCCVGFRCDTSTYDEIAGNAEKPTYTANIKSIINNNCLGCHSDAVGQYPTMETYVQVRDATNNGNVICRIDDQSCGAVMPQSGRMPQININAIKKWVANGYPN